MFEIIDTFIEEWIGMAYIIDNLEFIIRCVDRANSVFEAELWEL